MKHLWLSSIAIGAIIVELACVPGLLVRGVDAQVIYLDHNVLALVFSWVLLTLLLARLFTLQRALDATLPE